MSPVPTTAAVPAPTPAVAAVTAAVPATTSATEPAPVVTGCYSHSRRDWPADPSDGCGYDFSYFWAPTLGGESG